MALTAQLPYGVHTTWRTRQDDQAHEYHASLTGFKKIDILLGQFVGEDTMQTKRLLLTDLGNVLVSFRDRLEHLRDIVAKLGGNPEIISRIFRQQLAAGLKGEDMYALIDEGAMSFADLHTRIIAGSGLDLSPERLAALYARHLEPIVPVVELFNKARAPVVAVSNGDWGSRHAVDMLTVYHGMRFLETFVSCERHCRKPQLFSLVIKWLEGKGYRPEDCLFVDDVPAYCEAAECLGIRSLCFNATREPIQRLWDEFQRFGVI